MDVESHVEKKGRNERAVEARERLRSCIRIFTHSKRVVPGRLLIPHSSRPPNPARS